MFYLTSSEAKLFQVISLVDTLITSTVTAYSTAKSRIIEAWKVSKPYVILASKVAWVSFILFCGIAFYSGVLASKIYNWAKPLFLDWIDSIVQSGYAPESAVEPQETTVETSTPTATVEAIERPVIDLSAVKTYKLRGDDCVLVETLPFTLPTGLKLYKLRGKEAVLVSQLEEIALITN